LTVLAALGGSLLLLFLAAPVAELIVTGGAGGLARLGRDAELRQALLLTVVTATTATLLGVTCGTPVAYLLSRSDFRGRAILGSAGYPC
jgi:ABC-type sulfate transport system permease component